MIGVVDLDKDLKKVFYNHTVRTARKRKLAYVSEECLRWVGTCWLCNTHDHKAGHEQEGDGNHDGVFDFTTFVQ